VRVRQRKRERRRENKRKREREIKGEGRSREGRRESRRGISYTWHMRSCERKSARLVHRLILYIYIYIYNKGGNLPHVAGEEGHGRGVRDGGRRVGRGHDAQGARLMHIYIYIYIYIYTMGEVDIYIYICIKKGERKDMAKGSAETCAGATDTRDESFLKHHGCVGHATHAVMRTYACMCV
jgi:hypothetical protein